MAQFTFYNKKPNNYYLTRCLPDDDKELEITLPDSVIVDGIQYSYGIYKYAFHSNQITKKIIVPENVFALSENCFAGSNIQEVEFQGLNPPNKPNSILSLQSDAELITFIYPRNSAEKYENKGWVSYYNNDGQELIKVIGGKNIIPQTNKIDALYMAGEKVIDSIVLPNNLAKVEDMAFLGIQHSKPHDDSIFEFFNGEKSNAAYSVATGDLIELKDYSNKLIKSGKPGYDQTNAVQVAGPNSYYNENFFEKHPVTSEDHYHFHFYGNQIDSLAFQSAKNLKQLILGQFNDMRYIAPNAFYDCLSLEEIIFSKEQGAPKQTKYITKKIGQSDKNNCLCIKRQENNMTIEMPIWISKAVSFNITKDEDQKSSLDELFGANKNITEIPSYLFKDSLITGVLTIPANINRIGKSAFENCQGLTSIICEERGDGSPLIIEDYAFYNCQNITNIILPESNTIVGYRALAVGGEIDDEAAPADLNAFIQTKYSSVTIPRSITKTMTSIDKNAFTQSNGNTYLSNISLEEYGSMRTKYLSDINWSQYLELLQQSKNTTLIIPEGTEVIYANQYANFKYIEKVIIPTSVKSIETQAFKNCHALNEIVFKEPENFEAGKEYLTIGTSAFENCYGLYKIILPCHLLKIDTKAFYNCYKIIEIENRSKKFSKYDGKANYLLKAGDAGNGYIAYYLAGKENILESENDQTFLIEDGNIVYYTGAMRTYYNLMYSTSQKTTTATEVKWNGNIISRTIKVSGLATDSIAQPPDCIGSTAVIKPDTNNYWGGLLNNDATVKYIVHVKLNKDGVANISPSEQDENTYIYLYNYLLYSNLNVSKIIVNNNVNFIGHHAFADTKRLTTISYDSNAVPISAEFYWDGDETEFENKIFANCGRNEMGIIVTLGDSITEIKPYLFHPNHRSSASENYPKIIQVLITENGSPQLTKIHGGAFDSNLALYSFSIGMNVNEFGNTAFNNCPILYEIRNFNNELALEKEIGKTTYGQVAKNAKVILDATAQSPLQIVDEDFKFLQDADGNNILINYNGPVIYVTLPVLEKDGQIQDYSIGDNVFLDRTDIKKLILHNNITSLGASSCKKISIDELYIPSSIEAIGSNAFSNCTALKKIEIDSMMPNQSLTIGTKAFQQCSNLLQVPDLFKIKSIGQEAFSGCRLMASTDMVFPNWDILRGTAAFASCSKITHIKNFGGITDIPARSFNNCGLETLDFTGSRVKSIRTSAFDNCQLKTVVLSNTIETIEAKAFIFNPNLQNISVPENSKWFSSDNYCLYDKDKTVLKQYFLGRPQINEFKIPDTVTQIEAAAFGDDSSKSNFTSVVLPSGLTTIGSFAFRNQTKLQSIIIPKSVTTINDNIFMNCSNSLVIYCEANNKPGGWDNDWIGSTSTKVYWYSEKPNYDGNQYWHYDDYGKPQIWKI